MNTSALIILEIIFIVLIVIPTTIAFLWGAPFVPTPMARCRKMLDLADVKPGMKVYDLGCGDGRLVYLAQKEFGAKGIGFELFPFAYVLARIRKFFWWSPHRVSFQNFWNSHFYDADVIVCYLLPDALKKLKTKLARELRPGVKIISYAFEIEGWKPIYVEPKIPEKNYSRILVYEIGKQ